jgi:chromate transporter
MLRTLAWAFLRLGTIAFGGPAAHVALMEDEFVRRRQWLTRQEFLDLVGAASLIPGPSSTEVAIYVGFRRAGLRGLLLAGACFILPAAILTTILAAAYVRFGRLPAIGGVLYGVKAAIVAVIAQALVGFARTAIKGVGLLLLGIAAAVGSAAAGLPPLAILVGAGTLAAFVAWTQKAPPAGPAMLLPSSSAVGLAKVFATFVKIGGIVFGSGYVLLAFLRDDLVVHRHWLTEAQLIDAVAVGQVTPGPVFTTATFLGYLLAGVPGALVATVGVFLPSFVLVAVSGSFVARLRRSPVAGAFLDGVNAASLALMGVVTLQLAKTAIVDVVTGAVAIGAAALLVRWRVNSAWLVLGAAAVGLVARLPR